MKQFRCGDVVPGCSEEFTGATEGDILDAVAVHAREDHGIVEMPPDLSRAVRSAITGRSRRVVGRHRAAEPPSYYTTGEYDILTT